MLLRALARSIFALAAVSALASSSGVGVPRHVEVAGTPLFHAHVLGAYRYGFLLPPPRADITPAMARLHETLTLAGVPLEAIKQMPGMPLDAAAAGLPTIKSAALSPAQDLAIELALLVFALARLARPTLRAIAEMPPPRVPDDLWLAIPALQPPRPCSPSI